MNSAFDPTEPPLSINPFEASIALATEHVPDITRLLNTLLKVCNQHWISGFLFTNDPVHIPHLTSRSLFNTAFTLDLHITRAGFSTLQPDPTAQCAETHRFHARYLCVPSFTVDHTTVGVGVVETVETLNSTQLPESITKVTLLRNMRFVQNAKERWLIGLMDSPDDDRILMHNADSRWTQISPPHTFSAMFSRSKLLESVQSCDGHVTVQKLLSALLGFMHTSQLRACPTCGAAPGIPCMCYSLSQPPPNNMQFDSQMLKNSMTQDAGVYQGITNKVLFAGGRQVRHIKLGAYTSIQGVFDHASVSRLSRWALTKHASGVKEDPRQSALLLSSASDDSAIWTKRVQSTPANNDVDEQQKYFSEEVPEPFLDILLDAASQYPHALTVSQGPVNYGLELSSLPETTQANRRVEFEEVRSLTYDDQRTAISSSDGKHGGDAWWSRQWNEGAAKAMEAAAGRDVSAFVESGTADVNELEERDPRYKNAAKKIKESPAVGLDKTRGIRDLVRQIRFEERKERNRQSARRSNQRNKLKLEGLKKDLQASKEKVDKLRSEWLKLNEENLRLRNSVAAKAWELEDEDP